LNVPQPAAKLAFPGSHTPTNEDKWVCFGGGEWVARRLLAKQTTASKKQQQQLK